MRGAIFDDLVARLPEFDCRAPDLPGHGAAAGRTPTLDACADVIEEALKGAQSPVLIGWSMGAAAAWRYIATRGTGGLAGLVTVDMSPKILPAPDWPHGLRRQTAASVAASTDRFRTDWDGATHGIAATMFATPDGVPGLSREEARALILSHDPVAMRALWDDLVAMDARDTIPRIDIPWLICSGAKSRVYPATTADWLGAHAPDARAYVFDKSGHSPHLEEPDAFARVIRDFAGGL